MNGEPFLQQIEAVIGKPRNQWTVEQWREAAEGLAETAAMYRFVADALKVQRDEEVKRLALVSALANYKPPQKPRGRPVGSRKIDSSEMANLAEMVDQEVAEARSRGEKSSRKLVVTQVLEGVFEARGQRTSRAVAAAEALCKNLSRHSLRNRKN